MTDEQLSALLRLKRHEQPPAGYFEDLLKQVHARQRSELLRKPLSQIALERLHTFFGEHSMGSLSYAGAMAGLLVLGAAGIGLLTPGQTKRENAAQIVATATIPSASPDVFSLELPKDGAPPTLGFAQTLPLPPLNPQSGRSQMAHAPRYVIDARPASYEPSSNY